jgi:hypothetical protein
MDPYLDARTGHKLDPQWDPIRRAMGHTRMLADRMDLTAMAPHGRLASSAYCLANPGSEYVVYLPDGGSVTVDLSAGTGRLAVEWIDPGMGSVHPGDPVTGGAPRELTAPFEGDAVLYIRAR